MADDITFIDCSDTDVHGNQDAGVLVSTGTILGTWINWSIDADVLTATVTQHGSWPSTFTITDSILTATTSIKADADGYGDFLIEVFKKNWVAWSDIGAMDFTIGKSHEAGRKVMEWSGWTWAVKKLGNRAIAYGENGVTALFPDPDDPKDFGSDEIYRVGLKGKHACCGDDKIHFFIDNKGQMFMFAESLTLLDYSEYLSDMATNLVMSYDPESGLVYICDGSLGYVYSSRTGSLGEGPVNVTGIYPQGGTLYVASPAAITTEPFEICTDIYDLGTRSGKNIYSLELGTDLTQTLSVAIDHRLDKSAAFETTDWYAVDARGMVFIPVYCQEFRIRARLATYEYFELDHIIVNHSINAH